MSFIQITGHNLTDLWFNLMVHVATGNQSTFYNPSVFARRTYGFTTGVHFDKDIMEKDFYRYSGYDKLYKINRLRESYFTDKVRKQYDLLCSIIRNLQPRQARGFITFSEPAFNKTDRLKCLDTLFIQKDSMTSYEALIVFRNTEIWPKTYADFLFLYELLEHFLQYNVKCTLFSAFLTSSFINVHQSPTAAMLMRKYGITTWNEHFRHSLIQWKEKFNDPKILESLKLQWIARVVRRTHQLLEEDGVNLDMLIEGK